jgi:hypothetical protein
MAADSTSERVVSYATTYLTVDLIGFDVCYIWYPAISSGAT